MCHQQIIDVLGKKLHITDADAAGNYKSRVFKSLSAAISLWFDKQIQQWLTMQYRISISANYFEQIAKKLQVLNYLNLFFRCRRCTFLCITTSSLG